MRSAASELLWVITAAAISPGPGVCQVRASECQV
jgi:hypothetical protein